VECHQWAESFGDDRRRGEGDDFFQINAPKAELLRKDVIEENVVDQRVIVGLERIEWVVHKESRRGLEAGDQDEVMGMDHRDVSQDYYHSKD